MAGRGRRDIQRNLLLILLALLALGGLIVFVGVLQGGEVPVLMPEERARFLERRDNLADNGFANLTEAWTQLTGLGPVPVCEDLLLKQKLIQQPAANSNALLDTSSSLVRFMGAGGYCPNDDPRLREYMDKSEAVLPAVQTALAKPFIFCSQSSIAVESQKSGTMEPARKLVQHLSALALYRCSVSGDTAKATAILQDAITVCRKLEESSSFELNITDPHHGEPPGRECLFRVGLGLSAGYPWIAIPVVAKYAVDRNDPLDALLEMTRPALEEPSDRAAVLTAFCMMLDDTMAGLDAPPNMRFDQRMVMAVSNRAARRDAQILVAREADVREAVNGPINNYPEKMRQIAGDGGLFGPKFMTLQIALRNVTSVLEGHKIVAGLAVRLEGFRRDHGAYPDKLDELAPQYMSKVPLHPLYGEPLTYTKSAEGYVISENSAQNTPDMRRMRFREDIGIDMRVFAPPAPPSTPAPPPPTPAPPAVPATPTPPAPAPSPAPSPPPPSH